MVSVYAAQILYNLLNEFYRVFRDGEITLIIIIFLFFIVLIAAINLNLSGLQN